MTSTTQIIYQPYVAGARGSLKAGVAVACRTPEEGIRRAERALAGGSILGAEVVRVTHDETCVAFCWPQAFSLFHQLASPSRVAPYRWHLLRPLSSRLRLWRPPPKRV